MHSRITTGSFKNLGRKFENTLESRKQKHNLSYIQGHSRGRSKNFIASKICIKKSEIFKINSLIVLFKGLGNQSQPNTKVVARKNSEIRTNNKLETERIMQNKEQDSQTNRQEHHSLSQTNQKKEREDSPRPPEKTIRVGTGDVSQQLRALAILQRTRVLFLDPTLAKSPIPVTPALGNLMSSPGLQG